MEHKELSYTKLRKIYNPDHFNFAPIEKIENIDIIIGQERAVKAMEFGLKVKNSRYNMFVSGAIGTGKKSYAHKIINKYAKSENVPDDWCYVYNFDDPMMPIGINIPPGMGNIFKDDMEELIEDVIDKINNEFNDENYQREKSKILKIYQNKNDTLMDYLKQYCLDNGFLLKSGKKGFSLEPLIDGEVIEDKVYEELDLNKKREIENRATEVELQAIECIKKIKGIEWEVKSELTNIDNRISRRIVYPLVETLKGKYKEYEKICMYLDEVKADIIDNIYDFDLQEYDEERVAAKKEESAFLKKYKVNVFVNNGEQIGAPVVIVNNPNYNNLVGKIEYENEQGSLKTDFTMIKAGDIHKANGGYLILQAHQVLSNIKSWEAIKSVLETRKSRVESLRTQIGIVDIVSLKPESIDVDIKIILIGDPYLYHLLYTYDKNFEKFFKIKVDFDSSMDSILSNQMKTAQFLINFCEKEKLKKIDTSGICKMMEYSHRLEGTQKKLTTRFDKLTEILIEGDAWAEVEGDHNISETHVKKAYLEKVYRNSKIEEKIEEMYKDGKILFTLSGEEVGKINGLSVIDLGDYVFGKPSVITVTTFSGNKGIINIEREVSMSGNIHDKGVMILEGYLSEKFAKYEPLGVTARICFEQNYSGIDGDSASSTELYAILSSLSKIPLKQNIAVTGSVNQIGQIQPVGGVTEKIEGFFSLCKYKGLTGDQGVIIPHQNVDELVLCDEVVDAVREGLFHIYPISIIEEGIEILTNHSFEEISKVISRNLVRYKRNVKKGMK
ncbi:AAA family ATPase [Lutibacter sp. B2]|nr:AAA family ATPase [Lutibacter sp. B2]